jgi:predicted RNA-binding protein with PUA-like domain
MNYFLAKTDPETYSIENLEKDKKTVWDGIRNPQALRAIREMRPGDRIFIYHSQGEAAILGLAAVVSDPRPDPKDAKLAVVDFEFLTRLDPPVTLREIKQSPPVRRLVPGAPEQAFHYVRAQGVRRMDAQKIPKGEDLM